MKKSSGRRGIVRTYYTRRTTILVFILTSLLAACVTAPTAVPTPSETPTPIPTLTPTPIPMPIRLGNYGLLSPEDMRYDLDELFHRIETTHPDPYTKRPKAEVDIERQKIYDELDHPMTMFDYYNKVAPLVASLGDFHTQVVLPKDTIDELEKSELFFPFLVELNGPRTIITANYSYNSDIPFGTELLSINGTSLADIQNDQIFQFTNHLYGFSFGLWALYGSISKYQVDVLLPGRSTPIAYTISGLSSKTIFDNTAGSQVYEPLTYTKIPDESIGVLTINDFVDINPLLEAAFTQIHEDGVQNLIIDIRSNGGGFYEKVDFLMSYLTGQPYQECAWSLLAPLGGNLSAGPRKSECELRKPFNTSLRFTGKLYLLIGPDTFSAAITFASILQDYHLATLIGEETTDSASYCAFISPSFPLPRTKLSYILSTKCVVRPSGVLDNLPVIPDIIVKTTIEDQIAGRDPVMEYTLNLIRNSEQSP